MTPNSPLPVGSYPAYSEGSSLASSRDARNVSQSWKNARANTRQGAATQRTLSQIQDNLNRLRRSRPAGYIPAVPTVQGSVAGPFSIYQPSLMSGGVSITTTGGPYTVGQIVEIQGGTVAPGGHAAQLTINQVDASGNLLSGVVTDFGSYTAQPSYPASLSAGSATVTVLTSSDDWRIVQIRSGAISARSAWDIAQGSHYPLIGPLLNSDTIDAASGGNEWIFGLNLDGNLGDQLEYQGDYLSGATSPNQNGIVTLTNGNAPVLLYGYLPDGTFVNYTQICLDGDTNIDHGAGRASFWVEIVDNPGTGFYVNVYGSMLQGAAPNLIKTWPNGIAIIPIGWIQAPLPSFPVFEAFQALGGNLTSRWPAMQFENTPTIPGRPQIWGIPQVPRGMWTNNGLQGQIFYPGDTVIDDTITTEGYYVATTSGGSPTQLITFYDIYQFIAPAQVINNAPTDISGNLANWQKVGTYLD